MFKIGQLAKLAEVTPDTVRYYEKQGMMDHNVAPKAVIGSTPSRICSGCALFAMPSSWGLLWKRSPNCCRSASILSIIPAKSRSRSSMRA